MLALIPVLFVLLIAFAQYKQAKRNGQWSWMGFFAILGAMGLFIVGFIIPIVQSKMLETHPGWMMTALLSGISVLRWRSHLRRPPHRDEADWEAARCRGTEIRHSTGTGAGGHLCAVSLSERTRTRQTGLQRPER